MQMLTDLINSLSANWAGVLDLAAYIVLAASIVIKLIPTLDKNNRFLPFVKWAGKYLALDKGKIPEEDRPKKES